MKRLMILGRNAGGAQAVNADAVAESLRDGGHVVEVTPCGSFREAGERVRRGLLEGCDQIVAVGGDGTVNAVVQGFFRDGRVIRPGASLAVLPAGTGNDYVRTLRALGADVPVPADVAWVEGSEGRRYFLNMASAGLSARIVLNKSLQNWVPRLLGYPVATLRALNEIETWPITLAVDGATVFEGSILAALVCKGRFMGGGMKNGAAGGLGDGRLDVQIIGQLSVETALRNVHKLYTGRLREIPNVHCFRARTLTITPKGRELPFECDGDPAGDGAFRAGVETHALRVCHLS